MFTLKHCSLNFRWLKHSALALMFSIAASLAASQTHAQYVHTDGTRIVDGNGNPIFFNGINLGNWLLWEGYLMMGDFNYRTHTQFFNSLKNVLGGFDQAMAFEHEWRMNYVTEETIIELKNLGFNSVRVPFNYNMFWYNNAVSDHGFQYLDRIVEFGRKHQVYVLLDMHAAPGYQNPGDHSDNVDSNSSQPRDSVKFWDGNNVAIAAQVWRHIANRYKNEPIIWGYDLINEPVPQDGREYELLPSLVAMRNAIREVDNNHIIVAEASWWASDMSKIDWTDPTTQARTGITTKWDHNLVYETHHYVFGNQAAIADLYPRRDLTNRLGIPLILGELGEDTPEILRQMTDWSIDNIAGYFPWSFKKMSHDRTLWTIQPNDVYNQVKNAINNGEYLVPGAYEGVLEFARNNIKNGANGLVWHQSFYDGIKPRDIAPPPPPPTASTGPLTLFQHCDFNGYSVGVPTGDHTLGTLQSWGLANDDISSFHLAPGFLVEYFQHDNFTGNMHTATAGDNCLVNEGFNDDISSLKLRANGNPNLAGRYYIKNRKSGLFMDVQDFSTANGANILQWHFHGDSNQQYDLVHQGNGAYAIQPVVSGKALDVDAVSSTNGANVHQWDFVGGNNQKFIAHAVEGNFVQLVAMHSGKVIEVVNGSVDPGANVQQWDNNNQVTSHWELVPVSGNPTFNLHQEAESFSNSSAVTTEATSDPQGGNQNVGWIDAGDWMAYYGINFPYSGNYRFEFRVASPNSGRQISLDLNGGSIQLGTTEVPNTGGWQNWATASMTVYIEAGTYDLGIFAPDGGWNINWFSISND
ncbi:Endoglucanase C307 [Thalassocella blandensis]|nr:Endoglucanase C307 [Thalassocella blandensis]